MNTFESTIFINRTPQEVHDYITNPEYVPLWQDFCQSAEWETDGPPAGIGTQWRIKSKLFGRTIETINEITSWDPPHAHTTKSASGPIPVSTTTSLDAHGNGTNMMITAQAEFGGFFKLAEGLIGRQIQKQIETDLENLKQILEN